MCCEADWKREVVPDHKVSERADWPRQPAAVVPVQTSLLPGM
jgi:hypothetical protein